MKDEAREPVRCPKCASTDVRYSYTRNMWDMILDLLFSMDAFRCRSCRYRFHKFHSGGDGDDMEAQPDSKRGTKPE
jgi:transposase-like protein